MTESIPAEGYADAQGCPVGGTVERTPIGVADVMRMHGIDPATYVPHVTSSSGTSASLPRPAAPRIFMAGPGPNTPDGVIGAAFRALQRAGYDTADGYVTTPWRDDDDDVWREFLTDMMSCDGTALLDGWRESPGACFEAGYAWGRGLKVRPLQWWLDRAAR